MNEQENVSAFQEEELEGLYIQVCINSTGGNDCSDVPANGEWHLIGYCNGNVIFDNIEVHDRALSEDEISSAFQVFGNYTDRVLSQEEIEIIHRLFTNHAEIRSWQIRNNIFYLEVDEDI